MSYAGDNTDKLALNASGDWGGSQTGMEEQYQPGQPNASWVLGCATNPVVALITNGLIYPYVGSVKVYKCPADVKMSPAPNSVPTRRSYSMNAYMGGNWATESKVPVANFTKLSVMNLPTSLAIVFIEENPATINDGSWCQDVGYPGWWG